MVRHRLTDHQWELVQDLFPPPARTGRPRRDRREILDGILWILRTGAPWRDLPEEFGPWATVWDLFDTWNDDGTLDAILSRLRAAGIDAGLVDRRVVVRRRHRGPRRPMCRRGRQGRDPEEPAGSRPGAFPRGFLDEDPPAVRRPWPPAGLPPDGRAGARDDGLGPAAGGGRRSGSSTATASRSRGPWPWPATRGIGPTGSTNTCWSWGSRR